MATTKYQVMYRLVNDVLGTAITNKSDTEYEPTFEFYTDPDHKIFSSDAAIQNAEMEKQQNIITESNNAANPKHDMLFVFNGTKKILHQKWTDEQVGYIVRNWQAVRSRIGNQGDWTKEFFTINGESPELGGTVVAPQKTFQKEYKEWYFSTSGRYTESEIEQKFADSTIFKLKKPNWKDHATQNVSEYMMYDTRGNYDSQHTYRTGPMFIGVPQSEIKRYEGWRYSSGWYTTGTTGIRDDSVYYNNVYNRISHEAEDVEQITIPGHYEDVAESPYAIKDQYKRVESSPWIVNCTVGSLEAALTKARLLIEAIGIENVKIVKLVAFDQFVKIQ